MSDSSKIDARNDLRDILLGYMLHLSRIEEEYGHMGWTPDEVHSVVEDRLDEIVEDVVYDVVLKYDGLFSDRLAEAIRSVVSIYEFGGYSTESPEGSYFESPFAREIVRRSRDAIRIAREEGLDV